ncbi:MAG: chemotaxis-specific protein-glutamate methyltransferase CheB [bacterium]
MSIKTLIVDDQVAYRKLLKETASALPEIDIIGSVANGTIALRKLEQQEIDLILLDIDMPEMNGFQVLQDIKERFLDIAIIMLGDSHQESSEECNKAKKMGAIGYVHKPEMNALEHALSGFRRDLEHIIRLVGAKLLLKGRSGLISTSSESNLFSTKTTSADYKVSLPRSFGILAIGVSTGGPAALHRVIPLLPINFLLPVVIVQHMPENFTDSLALSLDRKSPLRVVEASENLPVKAGTVIIAKGGRHMVIRSAQGQPVIGLDDGPPENSCRPSVDVLFRSVAEYYGQRGVLAVIMTGMGSDGVAGVRALKKKNCYCLTQSERSCVVYGMPRGTYKAGLSDETVDLDNIAQRIIEIYKGKNV